MEHHVYVPCFRYIPIGIAAVITLTACSKDDPIAPPDGALGVRAMLASAINDTIDAPLLPPLIAEVRGRDGRLARGVIVRFEGQTATTPARVGEPTMYVCARSTAACTTSSVVAIDTTDAEGRAEASLRLGRVSGATYVRLRVPELGVADSIMLTVNPGVAVGVRTAIKDTLINIGNTITVSASVIDRYGNARSEAPVLTTGPENAFWSPDGVHLIGRDPNSSRLRVLNISTGSNIVLNRLTSDYFQPDWR